MDSIHCHTLLETAQSWGQGERKTSRVEIQDFSQVKEGKNRVKINSPKEIKSQRQKSKNVGCEDLREIHI